MNKHTPGPWTSGRPFPDDLDDYGTGIWIYAADAGGFMSSLASVRYGCTEAAEVGDIEANARLIAAAPDLLAALELAMLFAEKEATHLAIDCHMGASEWESFMPTWTTDARAAIAKAKGGADA